MSWQPVSTLSSPKLRCGGRQEVVARRRRWRRRQQQQNKRAKFSVKTFTPRCLVHAARVMDPSDKIKLLMSSAVGMPRRGAAPAQRFCCCCLRSFRYNHWGGAYDATGESRSAATAIERITFLRVPQDSPAAAMRALSLSIESWRQSKPIHTAMTRVIRSGATANCPHRCWWCGLCSYDGDVWMKGFSSSRLAVCFSRQRRRNRGWAEVGASRALRCTEGLLLRG